MKIGIMQPYFMPYLGYFQLMSYVDKYVVYDDVNYIKGGFVNRNFILSNGTKQQININLKDSSPNKKFNEIYISDNFKKLKKTIQFNYNSAINYSDISFLLDEIFSCEEKLLSNFLLNSYQKIFDYLGIKKNIILSSNLENDKELKGVDKVIDICKLLDGDSYINAIGGKDLYEKKLFEKNSLNLYFLESNNICYKQIKTGDFVSSLSIIDVLMNNEKANTLKLLQQFKLI